MVREWVWLVFFSTLFSKGLGPAIGAALRPVRLGTIEFIEIRTDMAVFVCVRTVQIRLVRQLTHHCFCASLRCALTFSGSLIQVLLTRLDHSHSRALAPPWAAGGPLTVGTALDRLLRPPDLEMNKLDLYGPVG
jgi:hypothetical protein